MEWHGPDAVTVPDEIVEAVGEAEVLAVHFAPVSRAVLVAAPVLRGVCVARTGLENVDVDAATARGVEVVPVSGRNAAAVAELAVGLRTSRRSPPAGRRSSPPVPSDCSATRRTRAPAPGSSGTMSRPPAASRCWGEGLPGLPGGSGGSLARLGPPRLGEREQVTSGWRRANSTTALRTRDAITAFITFSVIFSGKVLHINAGG
ncbi:hypothetical protein ACWC12_41370, partial [Streptomyces sp. NPDC001450]